MSEWADFEDTVLNPVGYCGECRQESWKHLPTCSRHLDKQPKPPAPTMISVSEEDVRAMARALQLVKECATFTILKHEDTEGGREIVLAVHRALQTETAKKFIE